jgi:hypothetical protein
MSLRFHRPLPLAAAALTAWAVAPATAVAPRFFPDDPIAIDLESQDARDVQPRFPVGQAENIEIVAALGGRGGRALNLNTIDEVPDSSWFTNRIATDLSAGAQAPASESPAPGTWTILAGESDGTIPRLTARDARGGLYALRFDRASNPEMTTGADAVATRLVHALGYHTALNVLTHVRAHELAIGAHAPVKDGSGRRRMMTRVDLEILLAGAARNADGRYRVIASRLPEGRDLGPFKFSGIRRDDPNDLFPHEHRRELRALRVVCAWLNHDDDRSLETRDVLVDHGGRRVVRHHLVDFGSTLGSGAARPGATRARNPYAWIARSKLWTTLTLGFWVRPWDGVTYPDVPSVGPFEAVSFAPARWTPRYRNVAFDRTRADDEFWAARRIAAISDEAIRTAVRAGEYSDPRAEAYLTEVLIARRDAVARVWLNGVLPLAGCTLRPDGRVTCVNVAVDAKAAEPADSYRVVWHRFDNRTESAEPVGEESVVLTPAFTAPPTLLENSEFIMAEIQARHPRFASWAWPIQVYFRRTAGGWRTVGLDRSVPSK